ncbi:hypothetical protein SK069_05165 [Patulibacter brassicae]|uniref:Ferritin-like domain-containing protein n=1 Tax=Patulibacter brassicae TaxID=1705717 RepID=A0ABU4VHR6_9ACTN|nr:hypothetical protein [Patulibacter brassicae]MDX8150975.1 hypothetical protein [Patulibacter brassicae]
MRAPTYDALLAISARNAWDPAGIALDADAARWTALPVDDAARLRALVAAFVVGEEAVADHLAAIGRAATDPGLRACLAAQEREEERHAAAVRRAWRALRAAEGGPDENAAAHAPAAIVALFRERLPATVARAAHELGEAVGLYHGLLEGVIFLAGQRELLARARAAGLAGLHETFTRIERDERWHVALGVRALVDHPDGPAVAGRLAEEADAVADAWGPLVAEATRREVATLVARRARAVGLLPHRAPA